LHVFFRTLSKCVCICGLVSFQISLFFCLFYILLIPLLTTPAFFPCRSIERTSIFPPVSRPTLASVATLLSPPPTPILPKIPVKHFSLTNTIPGQFFLVVLLIFSPSHCESSCDFDLRNSHFPHKSFIALVTDLCGSPHFFSK